MVEFALIPPQSADRSVRNRPNLRRPWTEAARRSSDCGRPPYFDQKPPPKHGGGAGFGATGKRRGQGMSRVQGMSWNLPAGRAYAASRRCRLWLAAIVLGSLLGGCALGASQSSTPSFLEKMFASAPEPEPPPPPEKAEKKHGCGSPSQCRSALKALVDSPKRGWVGQQMPPDHYADGTRLFAYRALRKRLTCNELSRAVKEVRAVSKSLNGPMPGVTADQATRTRALNNQVESELAQEQRARCRA